MTCIDTIRQLDMSIQVEREADVLAASRACTNRIHHARRWYARRHAPRRVPSGSRWNHRRSGLAPQAGHGGAAVARPCAARSGAGAHAAARVPARSRGLPGRSVPRSGVRARSLRRASPSPPSPPPGVADASGHVRSSRAPAPAPAPVPRHARAAVPPRAAIRGTKPYSAPQHAPPTGSSSASIGGPAPRGTIRILARPAGVC